MFKFISIGSKSFAFQDEQVFRLACYIKMFPDMVRVTGSSASIYHKRLHKTFDLTPGSRLSYRLDLVASKDATQLFSLCKCLQGGK